MTGPHVNEGAESAATRPISVAELLAKNGTIGSPPVTGRRRRRPGSSGSVTVAELTGEIPVITGDEEQLAALTDEDAAHQHGPNGSVRVADAVSDRSADEPAVNWAEPGPRWPASPPQGRRGPGPERSPSPFPTRKADRSGAEQMSIDPVDDYADIEVDVMDTDVRDAELPADDSAYVRSYLRAPRGFFGKRRTGGGPAAADDDLVGYDDDLEADLTDHDDDLADLDEDHTDIEADLAGEHLEPTRAELLRSGGLVVLQSILLAGFGAGMFLAFEKLWQWQHIVALVLSVLVTLGLVAAVQVVRKTVDTASTLIAVAVGLLITLGPLALLRSG